MKTNFIKPFLLIFSLISFVSNADEQCPQTVDPIEKPTKERPRITEFLETVSADTIVIYQKSSSKVQEAYWSIYDSCPSRNNPFGLIEAQNLDTTPPQKACVYIHSRYKTCPTGYELNIISGICELENSNSCSLPTTECPDGFPPDLLGYPDCDRPPIKQCSNGDYLLQDDICPTGPDPDPEPDPEPNPSYDISHVLNVIRDFKEQEQLNHENRWQSLDEIKFQVRDSSINLKAGIVDAINDRSKDIERKLDDNQEMNNVNAELNRDAIFTVTQGITTLQSTLDNQNDDVVNAINEQTISLNSKTSLTNSQLEITNSLLSQIKDNTSPCSPELNDCLPQDPSQCEPTEENNFCESEHGLTVSYIDELLSSVSGFFDDSLLGYQDSFNSSIDDLKNDSSVGDEINENTLNDFSSSLTSLIPPPSECVPLEIIEYDGITYSLTCEFSSVFKEIFSWIISVTTIFTLVSMFFTGFIPNPTR